MQKLTGKPRYRLNSYLKISINLEHREAEERNRLSVVSLPWTVAQRNTWKFQQKTYLPVINKKLLLATTTKIGFFNPRMLRLREKEGYDFSSDCNKIVLNPVCKITLTISFLGEHFL